MLSVPTADKGETYFLNHKVTKENKLPCIRTFFIKELPQVTDKLTKSWCLKSLSLGVCAGRKLPVAVEDTWAGGAPSN